MYNILYEYGSRLIIGGKKIVAGSQMFSKRFWKLHGMKSRQVDSRKSAELEYGPEGRLGDSGVPPPADRQRRQYAG